MTQRTIGVVGAGKMGGTLAALLARSGEAVVVANSRGPESLTDLVGPLGPLVTAAPLADVLASPVVLLAVPYRAVAEVAARRPSWAGQVVVDITNYFPAPDGARAEPEATRPTSQVVAERFRGGQVAKAFNTINWQTLGESQRDTGLARLVVPVAADDEDARTTVSQLIARIGLDPVPAGGLADTRRLEPGGPVFNRPMSRPEMESLLRGPS